MILLGVPITNLGIMVLALVVGNAICFGIVIGLYKTIKLILGVPYESIKKD